MRRIHKIHLPVSAERRVNACDGTAYKEVYPQGGDWVELCRDCRLAITRGAIHGG